MEFDDTQLSESDLAEIASNPNTPRERKVELLAGILVQIFLEQKRKEQLDRSKITPINTDPRADSQNLP